MEILKNQTLYKCSYCGQRKLTKKGCTIHEEEYCKSELSPHCVKIKEKQAACKHNNKETIYSYIPGEAVKEPDYDVCIDCGLRI